MESAELIALLHEVRDRVRARHPETAAGPVEVPLPDLMPVLHARDSALGKVAAIGTVNPRSGGPLNMLVQGWKRLVSRALDWHVREQVEFNRKSVASLDAVIEVFSEYNRSLTAFSHRVGELQDRIAAEEKLGEEMKDMRSHWAEWRVGWERKLSENEMQFLRAVADFQGAAQHRADLMDAGYRDLVRSQHADFTGALDRRTDDIQKRIWTDMENIRGIFEKLIHEELRIIRQRAMTKPEPPPTAAPPSSPEPRPALGPAEPIFDYRRFAERFRGSEDYVKAGQKFYLDYFAGRTRVLDIGCGRGEFLELMQSAGVSAHGIDLSEESVALCRAKGLAAEAADLFAYLEAQPEGSFDGIFCAQVVEHLPPERLPAMVRLAASRLERGGVIAIETPNPECLAIFATHFYLDPTHTRPVPHALLGFYLEEFGVGKLELRRLSPAAESMPSLVSLPADFRDAFFDGLDYAVIGRKL